MKKMKKTLMKFAAIFVIALAVCVTSVTSQAKTKTQKITLFVGDSFTTYPIEVGKIKSVSSSKKKICTVKKKNGNAVLKAKKAGSSKVTIKGSRGKFVYNVTVKKNPFKITFTPIADGNMMMKVQNTSSAYFDWIDINITLCDSAGNPITQKNDTVFYIGSKQTAYDQVYVFDDGVDLSKTKYAITEWRRTPDATYKNYSKQVNVSVFEENGYIKLRANTNYKGNGSIYVDYDYAIKDQSGNIIRVESDKVSLYNNKKVDTTYGIRKPDEMKNYEILSKRVYLKNY